MKRLWLVLLCIAGLAGAVRAADAPDPVFKDLAGVEHHPLSPGASAASVLIFYEYDCPICNGYAPEINRICAAYTNIAFYIVQVDPDLKAEAAREHARQFSLRPPVLLDPEHRLVKLAGATITPEVVVFGADGRVLYRGRIDDRYPTLGKKRAHATQYDLLDVLKEIVRGKLVTPRETAAMGCVIESPPETKTR
jgi:hypothetical protein